MLGPTLPQTMLNLWPPSSRYRHTMAGSAATRRSRLDLAAPHLSEWGLAGPSCRVRDGEGKKKREGLSRKEGGDGETRDVIGGSTIRGMHSNWWRGEGKDR